MQEEENKCLECSDTLLGRSDKRFCSDHCRSSYYNRENKQSLLVIKETNKILRKNYKILKKLNPNGKRKIKRDDLLMEGLNMKYFTSIYTTKDDRVYYFVYDQGYIDLDNDYFAIVEKRDWKK